MTLLFESLKKNCYFSILLPSRYLSGYCILGWQLAAGTAIATRYDCHIYSFWKSSTGSVLMEIWQILLLGSIFKLLNFSGYTHTTAQVGSGIFIIHIPHLVFFVSLTLRMQWRPNVTTFRPPFSLKGPKHENFGSKFFHKRNLSLSGWTTYGWKKKKSFVSFDVPLLLHGMG